MFAVVLTGPPGAGKSMVLEALADALYDDDVRHAALEVEAVSWAHPDLAPAQRLAHVQALSRLYASEGHDLLLVAAPVESSGELADLLSALGADERFLARLDASEAVLRQRIVAREPPGWSQLDRLLSRSSEMRLAMASLSGADLVIDTDALSRTDIVARIRSACPRLGHSDRAPRGA